MSKNIILYHKNCTDGFGSAWAAWRKFGDSAVYTAVSDRNQLPEEIWQIEGLEESTLYVIDFCYPKETIEFCKTKFQKVVILDHHVTSQEDITFADEYVYGTDKSGAYLAWEYFFPESNIPKLIAYISDGDTWQHALPYYQEVLQYIYNQEFSFEAFEELYIQCEFHMERVLDIGGELVKGYKKRLDIYLERAEVVELEGHTIYAVNAPGDLASDIGHTLAQKTNSFAIVFNYDQGRWKCSLRSVSDFDVSKIAEKYGGGGHKNAAAFLVPTEFPIQGIMRVPEEPESLGE
jgi:uncharacterized protein